MRKIISHQIIVLIQWGFICGLIYAQLSLFVVDALAQDPTAEPPSSNSPADRFIDFRVDDDDIESGECIEFSWIVRGDIDRVEFNQKDDNKDAVLVSSLDDREECPTAQAEFELTVRWLDGAKTTREIEVDVNTANNNDNSDGDSDGGGSSNSSSNTGSGGAGTSPTVGVFVQVTPILITNTLFNIRETPVPESSDTTAAGELLASVSGNVPVKPTGVLGTIVQLPETGEQPALPQQTALFPRVSQLAALLGGVIFSLLLLRLLQKSA
jgi:hypothetical protein